MSSPSAPSRPRRVRTPLALALFLVCLALPASAFGQASRTWVSGVGDDANPCSRTAPCKTFAGAISKTAAGGEINAIDPGGFGAVTITKAITIAADGVTAGVLVSGTNAIVVNAGSTDHVTLRGLDINGLGNSLDGVKILGGSTRIEHTRIYNFTRSGISFEPSGTASLVAEDSTIHDNRGNGVTVAPAPGGIGVATLRRMTLDSNACAAVATSTGLTHDYTTNCGTTTTDTTARATLNTYDSSAANNTAGIFSNGANALSRIGGNTITDNFFGLRTLGGGVITSLGGNRVVGNLADGSPSSTVSTKSSTRVLSQVRARGARRGRPRHHRHHRHAKRHHARS